MKTIAQIEWVNARYLPTVTDHRAGAHVRPKAGQSALITLCGYPIHLPDRQPHPSADRRCKVCYAVLETRLTAASRRGQA